MDATRERTLVGLFVVIAAALLFVSVLALSGGFGAPAVPHRSYFKYAGGVQPGAAVRFGGLLVGKVDRVRVDPSNSTRIEIHYQIDHGTPVKTDSIAKITTLGPLTDNYIEITTGTLKASLLPPDSEIPSAEIFGLPQIGEAMQAMLPDVQTALGKVNKSLDDLQVTVTRANDLLNDRNRAAIAHTLSGADQLISEARPQANQLLANANHMLNDAQPKLAASLSNVQDLTTKLTPLLEEIQKVSTRAGDTLAHVDGALVENRADVRASVTTLRDALSKSTVLLDHLNQALDQNADNIDELLDNLRVSTENLKGLTETLRSKPASLIRGIRAEDRKPGGVKK
ncbi:MAG TPA: MlaD family protein [Candidatus Sulfopaludibacter sp.]|jgi:phospholipid/cholesterol/gamma-HCH transport system substrate-binding protein|nr:MlaD family protein [Candidatus Sulfopaludibacter sp.]